MDDPAVAARLGAHVDVLEVIAGDDENDGRGVERDSLFGSLAAAAAARHVNGTDGALGGSKGSLGEEAALGPGQTGAEQLQQRAAKLWAEGHKRLLFTQHHLNHLQSTEERALQEERSSSDIEQNTVQIIPLDKQF